MKKYFWLVLFGLTLMCVEFVLRDQVEFDSSYQLMVIFFIFQTGVLFRLEDKAPKNLKVQISMVKTGIRFLSALAFALVVAYSREEDLAFFFIQFIIFYLVFMAFEIIMALSNLRRN